MRGSLLPRHAVADVAASLFLSSQERADSTKLFEGPAGDAILRDIVKHSTLYVRGLFFEISGRTCSHYIVGGALFSRPAEEAEDLEAKKHKIDPHVAAQQAKIMVRPDYCGTQCPFVY